MYAQHTITSYRLVEQPLYGNLPKQMRYDLMELVLVCLGTPKSKNKGNDLHGFLDTLLSPDLAPHEKENILANDYGIQITVEQEGDLRLMCNLSDLIEDARSTNDKAVRSDLYQDAMEQILDLAIELPVYQRSVLYAYNSIIF